MGARLDDNHESTFFQRANDRVLQELGSHWSEPQRAAYALRQYADAEQIADRVRTLVASPAGREYWGFKRRSSQWGWKDPRTGLLLPIWSRAFPDAQLIFIRRDEERAAASLARRSQHFIDLTRQLRYRSSRELLLWYRGFPVSTHSWRSVSVKGALAIAREYETVLSSAYEDFDGNKQCFHYDDLVDRPLDTVREIAMSCGVSSRTRIAAAAALPDGRQATSSPDSFDLEARVLGREP